MSKTPDLDDSADLLRGRGGPDLQEDILDSQQTMGLEGEISADQSEREAQQLDVLEGLRQMQTPDPITWKIHRYGHEESKYNGYLGELQTTSLTMEHIRKKFGGGQYRIRGTFPGGKYATQRQISVAGESILYVPMTVNGAAPVTPNSPAFNMSEFMAVQQSLDEKREAASERRRQEEEARSERRSKENREFFLALGTVAAPIITALVQRPTPAAQPVVQAQPAESPVSSMKGMLELMTMMKSFIVPETSSGSELAEIIQAVTPIAGPALQAFANRPQPPVQVRPRVTRPNPTAIPTPAPAQVPRPGAVTINAVPVQNAPVPVPAPSPRAPIPGETPTVLQPSQPTTTGVDLSAPSQPMTSEQQTMFAQMKPQVDSLVQLAADGQDPAAVAEMFFDTYMSVVPDDKVYEQLCVLFEDPATIGRLALFNKGVNDHRPWFETLQATLVKKINQETAAATVSNPEIVNEPG